MANIYTDEEWETFCTQCGSCCYEKIQEGDGTIFFTAIPCEYLDEETARCSVYEHRFEVNPHCVKLTEKLVRKLRWLKPDCGYRTALGLGAPDNPPVPYHATDLEVLAVRDYRRRKKSRRGTD